MERLGSKSRLGAALIACAIASFGLGSSLVNASAENVTADILACINKNTGSVRISKVCSPRETPFQWLINGLTGKQGVRGAQILSGQNIQDPESRSLGDIGDYFLSISDSTLYGPRNSKGWPTTGIKLQGPVGPQGDKGMAGPSGPTGPTGPAGQPGTSVLVTQSQIYKVVSANNVIVGTLIGSSNSTVTVLSNGLVLQYWFEGSLTSSSSNIIYLTNDCTGPLYTSSGQGFSSQLPFISILPDQNNQTGADVFRYPSSSTPISHTGYSYYDGPTCRAEAGATSVVLLDQVVNGITRSFQGPLKIVQN